MSNKFFCPLPWNHLLFKQKGTVQACCETWDYQFKPAETIRATANLDIMKQLRLDLLDEDTVPDMCHTCYNREKFQDFSVRTNSIEVHPHWTPESARAVTSADGSVDNFHLEHLDIRWSNLCNYKCRFCSLYSSNSWLEDAKLLGQVPTKEFNPKTGIAEYNMDWEDLKTHLPYVKFVKLAGGEPTIMPGTYQLLEELIRVENKNCWISLITNGTTIQYGKYNLLELLKYFKGVRIQLSMEGMGNRHAWARSGKDDWHIIEKNIEQFETYTKEFGWKLNFHTGISWMNMYHLANFILKYPNIEFTFNMVTQPEEMSITNFYKKDLEKCSLYYEKLLPNSPSPLASLHLRKVKKAIDQTIETTDESIDLEKFKRVNNILDDNRKQNFAEAYPEWSHLYA